VIIREVIAALIGAGIGGAIASWYWRREMERRLKRLEERLAQSE
jgi:hypothetical protein